GNISHYSSTYPYEDVYLTWEGRQLVSFFPDDNGGFDFYFSYDDEGRHISKGTEDFFYTNYVYEGDLLVAEIQNCRIVTRPNGYAYVVVGKEKITERSFDEIRKGKKHIFFAYNQQALDLIKYYVGDTIHFPVDSDPAGN
ncbi:MAG: hypothetical protein IJW83_00850, partial [Clostridia bacterium]|nr:hypothetical protein [Clostridia bacterium]